MKKEGEVGTKCRLVLDTRMVVQINSEDLCPACRNGDVEALDPRREVYDVVGGYEYRIL